MVSGVGDGNDNGQDCGEVYNNKQCNKRITENEN